jgi:hypothetical protein
MMHLTESTYAALLSGTLPPGEARALAEHLGGACEPCERFLAERDRADGLDGLAEEAVASAFPPRGGRGDDLEFARIQRALRAGGRARRLWVPGAIAASLLIAGVAGLVARQLAQSRPAETATWDGTKGLAPRPVPVRLRFLKVARDGAVEKGLTGERVDREAGLLFEVEADRGADVILARVAPGGGVEPLWHGRVPSGPTQITLDGKPAAYPLAALTGPQRFVLLAAETALDAPRAARAAEALAPPERVRPDLPALDGLSFDVIEIHVR